MLFFLRSNESANVLSIHILNFIFLIENDSTRLCSVFEVFISVKHEIEQNKKKIKQNQNKIE